MLQLDLFALADAEKTAVEEAKKAEAEQAREQARIDKYTRELQIPGIEESIEKMAEEHVFEGYIEGPILSVTCTPAGAGSSDPLLDQTTVFECFVANEQNGDGTKSGYFYNSTMNWSTGSYTYGLGQP